MSQEPKNVDPACTASEPRVNEAQTGRPAIGLLSAEAWLAAIVENSEDAIISKSVDGIITSWNNSAERVFGFAASEAVGQPITIIVPPELLHEEATIIAHIQAGERIEHLETVRRRKDGTLVDISLTVSPVRDKDGTILGASKIVRDISERNQLVERQDLLLREMNHRIKNLFAVMNALVSLSERTATSVKSLASDLRARISALAAAHSLTLPGADSVSESSGPVRLFALVEAISAAHQDKGNERIAVKGDDISVDVSLLTPLALLLHEFVTNSIKYGALSTAEGYIEVDVREEDGLSLEWKETGGPPVKVPAGPNGFGSRLERAAIDAIKGSIARHWKTHGLSIKLRIPQQSDAEKQRS
ncbi:sensor histidine kinase [Rhizobium paranaense]|uniref:Blue-light-activated histidine kinase n=1 Tax=Rhizobium paranaense TaxID=1650438 RepID=A0A7W8XY32_9HYPH|nr:PAS domain S-box protein [Rhizobium paranaense]MBB5577705.1 PAS domain S-box-containing protein [Rhizobium paranaense]